MTQTATNTEPTSARSRELHGSGPGSRSPRRPSCSPVACSVSCPSSLALPVIGVVLAFGSPPDHVADARPIARRPRNAVIGVALVAALAVVILQPQLSLPLVTLFGLDGSGLAVTCLAVVALALPLAMADAKADVPPTGWFLLTRRNLILSLTVFVVVADWYGARGLSLLPIGGPGAHLAADHRAQPDLRRPAPTARIRPPPPTAPRRTRTAAAATGQRGTRVPCQATSSRRRRSAVMRLRCQARPGSAAHLHHAPRTTHHAPRNHAPRNGDAF